jgi:seryl-tRNA synthetase
MKKEDIDLMIGKLRQQRDELKVKIHLAKADAEDEWAKAEKKWEELKPQLESMAATGGEVAKELGGTIKEIGGDIMNGYERISKIVKK